MTGYFHHLYKAFQGEILAIPGRMIAFLFCLFLVFIPFITADPYILRILILANVYAIFAASWDLLSGFTGQMNLGHALFFGVAAYTAALLNMNLDLAPWATIPIGALAAVGVGLIAGIPSLRLRGHSLALVTLAFPIILTGIIFTFPDFTGGELGLSGMTHLSGSRTSDYYLSFFLMIGCALVMWKLTDLKSGIVRTGVILHAIREDEVTARASGINTTKYKLLVFSISGFFSGIAGGFYAHFMGMAGPSTLEVLLSFQAIIWVIFGGIATIYGAIAGVYILYPLTELLRTVSEVRMLIFALVVIFVLLFMPEGITTWVRDKIEEECPRCKVTNIATRKFCRACGAALKRE